MFRISKSDDPIERRDSEDETADRGLPLAGSGSTVASSALRWLRKAQKPPEPAKEPEETAETQDIGFFRPSAAEEELELTELLTDTGLDDDGGDIDQLQEPDLAPADVVDVQVPDPVGAPDDAGELPFEFDDDDDIDDFDDLGDISAVLSPSPRSLEKTSFFPDTDLDDISSPDDFEGSAPSSTDPVTSTAEPDDVKAMPPSLDDLKDDQVDDTGGPDVLDATSPEPLVEEPVLKKASRKTLLDEISAAPPESSLALQPIPELQSEPASSLAASKETQGADIETVGLLEDGNEVDDFVDDDLEAPLTEADVAEMDMLDLEGLELDQLEMETTDQSDDHPADDWHAHMADVLAGSGAVDENTSADHLEKTQPPQEIEPATSVLPLSKTLTQLVTTSEPEPDTEEPPVPTFLTRTARQKTSSGQPPSTLPADRVDMSPSQLSLGIITNVPRLRRFAAVQIGDELVADQLVQNVIETALADPISLQDAFDLGLGLITLLHQQREDMLTNASAPERSLEAARAFETALCRGLAGADQFEIHQFAQAINGLDEPDRVLLVLVALENLAYDQIANVIQVPTEQIMSMISGARMRLRQALATDEPGVDSRLPAIGTPHSQEIEIHGYLDGELDAHHMADVDALVEYDEDAADRLLHYGIQGDLIRRLYAPLLNRPVPGKMLDALGAAARPARRSFGFSARRALSAGAFVIVLGSAIFWPYLTS